MTRPAEYNDVPKAVLDAFDRATTQGVARPNNPASNIMPASAEDADIIAEFLCPGVSIEWKTFVRATLRHNAISRQLGKPSNAKGIADAMRSTQEASVRRVPCRTPADAELIETLKTVSNSLSELQEAAMEIGLRGTVYWDDLNDAVDLMDLQADIEAVLFRQGARGSADG